MVITGHNGGEESKECWRKVSFRATYRVFVESVMADQGREGVLGGVCY